MRVVLDTNIWVNALQQDWNNRHFIDCLSIIGNFMQTKSDSLAVDYSNSILEEYRDNVGDQPGFQQMLVQLFAENRIQYVDEKLSPEIRKKLDELEFHEPEDRVFLGVAYNGDKYLITGDSDYGVGDKPGNVTAYRYFTTALEMRILSPAEGAKDTGSRMVVINE
ncbi:MAG: putative toxin-antitoxin system toxin component, PIN family [Lachnospiraceae bacterium]|nr:putative toxin-antitoxin system toxin component, PIN family [Lachnospiraceae bacterium]